jgi:hypothetical protein
MVGRLMPERYHDENDVKLLRDMRKLAPRSPKRR